MENTGPVYLEGRLVLSLSFQAMPHKHLPLPKGDPLENYRLWDDAADGWFPYDLTVLRFEDIDVVMRNNPHPTAVWSGSLNTHARVIQVPDLDTAGFKANQAHDLCWRRA